MARTYNNPPLIEAVCAFTFKNAQPWDLTIPGLVYEQIRAKFPVKEQGNIQEMKLERDERRIIKQTAIRFLNEDKTALVQIAPNLLTMHRLHSYHSWNDFKKQILENLAIYYEVTKSPDLKRVELRYVNRIELSEDAEVEAYFYLLPQIPGHHPAFCVRRSRKQADREMRWRFSFQPDLTGMKFQERLPDVLRETAVLRSDCCTGRIANTISP
ncbi:MAG: TIGR04255 family protein [Chloroflexota bacterium]|nr:TIGR04255 family protein [Chloroflexota bacterium]